MGFGLLSILELRSVHIISILNDRHFLLYWCLRGMAWMFFSTGFLSVKAHKAQLQITPCTNWMTFLEYLQGQMTHIAFNLSHNSAVVLIAN